MALIPTFEKIPAGVNYAKELFEAQRESLTDFKTSMLEVAKERANNLTAWPFYDEYPYPQYSPAISIREREKKIVEFSEECLPVVRRKIRENHVKGHFKFLIDVSILAEIMVKEWRVECAKVLSELHIECKRIIEQGRIEGRILRKEHEEKERKQREMIRAEIEAHEINDRLNEKLLLARKLSAMLPDATRTILRVIEEENDKNFVLY